MGKKTDISFSEKEQILVQRIDIKDMMPFDRMPYQFNAPIYKHFGAHAHPFAYINLDKFNMAMARAELDKMNAQIAADSILSPAIPNSLRIPVDDIVFVPSKEIGYTRIICTPYTFSGKISKYPFSLVFMTNLYEQKDSTHGCLFYSPSGNVAKADVYFWRGGEGFFFYYETINQSLVLSRVEFSGSSGIYQGNVVLYKNRYWIDLEIMRQKEALDFEWLQKNLSDICPKSYSGYKRMKNGNTKNYQKIVAKAKELGRDIL